MLLTRHKLTGKILSNLHSKPHVWCSVRPTYMGVSLTSAGVSAHAGGESNTGVEIHCVDLRGELALYDLVGLLFCNSWFSPVQVNSAGKALNFPFSATTLQLSGVETRIN